MYSVADVHVLRLSPIEVNKIKWPVPAWGYLLETVTPEQAHQSSQEVDILIHLTLQLRLR